jgi:MoaA/NifB/PqqE/SkfB family radical SAM enzyme
LVLDDLKWIIDEMNKSGIPTLSLGGGEPLLFKDIFKVIQYAREFGIKCSIMTNGMLLPRLSQTKIELLKACESTIGVSVDSFSTDKEEYIRGVKNALSLPIEGINLLVKQQIPVDIMTVISAHNYQDLFDIVVNANRLGADSVAFQPVMFVSCFPEVEPIPNKKSFNVLPEHLAEIEDQFQRIMDFERDDHINTNVYVLRQWLPDYIQFLSSMQTDDFFFKKVVNRFWCTPLYTLIAINYYGDILPCNMLQPAKSIKDRDREDKSLLELWNDSCKPVRSMIKRRQYPDACKSCVCAFDSNVLCSTLKYPLNNFHLISKVLMESVKRQIGKR